METRRIKCWGCRGTIFIPDDMKETFIICPNCTAINYLGEYVSSKDVKINISHEYISTNRENQNDK